MTTGTGAAPRAAARALLPRILAAGVLVPIASTLVAVTLPAILADLELGPGAIWWLVTGYLAVVASLQVPAGRLGDRVGPRAMLLAGVGLLAVASLTAAVAPGPVVLVVARLAQGAAGAALVPAGFAALRRGLPSSERDRAVGRFTSVLAGGGVIGIVGGGLLVDAGGWRTAFAAVAAAAAVAAVPLYRLARAGPDEGESEPADARGDAAGTGGGWFVPAARIALVSLAFYVVLLVMPLRLAGAGFSGAVSGLLVGTFALGAASGALVDAPVTSRLGHRRAVVVLAALPAGAFGVLALAPMSVLLLAVCLVPSGIGLGALLSGGFSRGLNGTDRDRAGAASGRLSLARYVGSIAGTAALPPLLDGVGTTGGLVFAAAAAAAVPLLGWVSRSAGDPAEVGATAITSGGSATHGSRYF